MEEPTTTTQPKKVGKRSLPKTAPRRGGAVQVYAYEIKDKAVGNFLVQYSANAWWMETGKVEKLIDAFKIGCEIDEACVFAGISINQYEYFVKVHPEFYGIKRAAKAMLDLAARNTLAEEIKRNPGAAYTHLQKKEARKEKARQKREELEKKQAEENKAVKPNAIVFVDFGEPLPPELQALENQDFAPDVTEDGHA